MGAQFWVMLVEAAAFVARGRRSIRGQRFTVGEEEAAYYRNQGGRFSVTPVREGATEPGGKPRRRSDVRTRGQKAEEPEAAAPEVAGGGDNGEAGGGKAGEAEGGGAPSVRLLQLARLGLEGMKPGQLLAVARDLGVDFELKQKGKITKAERADLVALVQRRQTEILAEAQSGA